MLPDTRIYDAAKSILDNLGAELTARGIDVPSRRYVNVALAVQDLVGENCADQFIVSWKGLGEGQVGNFGQGAGGPQIRCAMPLVAVYEVALFRCVPTGTATSKSFTPPSAAELEASALAIASDAMTMAAAIVDLVNARALIDPFPPPYPPAPGNDNQVGIGSVGPVPRTGGLGGTRVSLSVSLL